MRFLLTFVVGLQTLFVFSQQDPLISYELSRSFVFRTTANWAKTSDYQDKKRGVEIVNLQRSAVVSDSGESFVATQSCKIERVGATNIKNYSILALGPFQKKKDFRIIKTITHTDGLLPLEYAIGYWAYYVDDQNKLHKLIIIHGLHQNGKGIQFFIDCPNEVFVELEEEITAEIRTMAFL